MKKKSASQSAFFNLRVLIGLFIVVAGVVLALLSSGVAQVRGNPPVQQKQLNPYAVKAPPPDKFAPVRMVPEALPGPVSFGGTELPARVRALLPTVNALINNNNGSTGTSQFTQSENTVVAFGSTVVVGFNDSGSFATGSHFTGWSRSTDNGATWTDGGALPSSSFGDAGDPSMARDTTTGRIYFATLGFSNPNAIPVFRSDDGGATWMAPVNGTPGGSSEDKEWITVDNFAGSGQSNVYLVSRNFGGGNGVRFYRSTDNGSTWGPSGGTLIVSGMQGAFVTVSPDHSVHAYWYDGSSIKVRKSFFFSSRRRHTISVSAFLLNRSSDLLHTLGASLNIRHNLSSSKGPKPLQLKLLTTYIPKTSAFTLAFSTSQRLRTTRASARTFFTFRHYITPSARNF